MLFVFDRVVKIFAMSFLKVNESVAIIKKFFHITLTHNKGIAFGLFKRMPPFFLAFIGVMFLVILSIYTIKSEKSGRWQYFATGLIFIGAVSNIWDRISYGYVIDFLDFRVWPVFNFSDCYISIGVGMLVLKFLGILGKDRKEIF